MLQGLSDVHSEYEKALLELATSLQLSRNVFIALISLQSWKAFMRRWLRADILFFDAKAPSISLDKITKAANDILKVQYPLKWGERKSEKLIIYAFAQVIIIYLQIILCKI